MDILRLFVLLVAACIMLYSRAKRGRDASRKDDHPVERKEPPSTVLEEDIWAVEDKEEKEAPLPAVVVAATLGAREELPFGFHSPFEAFRGSAIDERYHDQQGEANKQQSEASKEGQVYKKPPRPLLAKQLMARLPGQSGLVAAYEILSRPVGMRSNSMPWDSI